MQGCTNPGRQFAMASKIFVLWRLIFVGHHVELASRLPSGVSNFELALRFLEYMALNTKMGNGKLGRTENWKR